MDIGKVYDRANRDALWQVVRMCDVFSIVLNGIKIIYVKGIYCVGVKGGERKCN